MEFNGVVAKIFSKDMDNKKLYSFALADHRGTYFNLGQNLPPQEGQQVSFEAKQGSRPNAFTVDAKSLVVGKDTPVESYKAPFRQRTDGAVRSAQAMNQDQYWRRREERDVETQKRIEMQACRNAAIATAAIVFKVGTPLDVVGQFIDEVTNHYLEKNKGGTVAAETPIEGNVVPNTDEWS